MTKEISKESPEDKPEIALVKVPGWMRPSAEGYLAIVPSGTDTAVVKNEKEFPLIFRKIKYFQEGYKLEAQINESFLSLTRAQQMQTMETLRTIMREADPSLESRIIININTYEKLVNLLKIFDSNSVHQE